MNNRITKLEPPKIFYKKDINLLRKGLFNNFYFENNSGKYPSLSNKNFCSLKNLRRTNLNLISRRK